MENDVDTLHEERIHLVGTNYIGYIDYVPRPVLFTRSRVYFVLLLGQNFDQQLLH